MHKVKYMNELILIFDDLGEMYEVENLEEMLSVIDDLELLPIFKATVYEHKLFVANEELVSKGYLQASGRPYNIEAGERGVNGLTEEVKKRFGEDAYNQIYSEIDLSFERNKPKLPNKRKPKNKD